MARICPRVTIFGYPLNPGPFTIKEHVVVTIMANVGAESAYAVRVFSERFTGDLLSWLLTHNVEYRPILLPCSDCTMDAYTILDTNGW